LHIVAGRQRGPRAENGPRKGILRRPKMEQATKKEPP
jgi:hypothetical protein